MKENISMGAESLLSSESYVSSSPFPRRQRGSKAIGSLMRWISTAAASRLPVFKIAIVLALLFMLLLVTMDHLSPNELKPSQRGEKWVQVLSSSEPRAFIYHNFLSKEECEHLIAVAKPHMKKSAIVDSETGQTKDSSVRTSTGMFINRGQGNIVRDIEQRIADFTFIPIEHGEGLQILHYQVGQKYEPHADFFVDKFSLKHGGQRIATLLMYLSDVEEGGETVFPYATGNISSVPWWNELSECAQQGLAVKPKMGDALLFWSMNPDATLDPTSVHGSCPVIKGNKWSATKWMHDRNYPNRVRRRKEA